MPPPTPSKNLVHAVLIQRNPPLTLTQRKPPPPKIRVVIHAIRPRPLHHPPVLALRLALPDPHLLEEDVRGVVRVVAVARQGALLGQKVVEAAREDAAAPRVRGGDGAEEGGLRDAVAAEGGTDVAAGGVARVVDGDGWVGSPGREMAETSR